MNNHKTTKNIVFCVIGAVLLIAGILLAAFYTVPQGVMPALPFVLGGYGLLALFSGLSNMSLGRMRKKDSSFAKQINNYDDERSAFIDQKAKAATHDFTTIIFLAFIAFLAVMQVHLAVLFAFVGAFFIRIFVLFYHIRKYDKEM